MNSEVQYCEANELARQGRHAEAVSAFKRLVAAHADPRFHIAFGLSLQALGHWEESVDAFQRGIDLRPHYCEGDTRLMLAESLMKCGRKRDAVAQWTIVAAMPATYPSHDAVPDEARRMLALHKD